MEYDQLTEGQEQKVAAATSQVDSPSTSSCKSDGQGKKQYFSLLKKQKPVINAKLSADKHKIANIPFTTRSGKERFRPWPFCYDSAPVSEASPCASHDDVRPSPSQCRTGIKKSKTIQSVLKKHTKAVEVESVCWETSQIPEKSLCTSAMCEPDLYDSVLVSKPPSTTSAPSDNVWMSTTSVAVDIPIEDATLELQQDEEDISDAGANEDVNDEDVLCLGLAPVEAVLARDKEKSIVMPGYKTKKSTSYVWNYFYPNPDNCCLAICTICKATVSRGRDRNHLGTSSMLRHLQRIHGNLLCKSGSDAKKITTNSPASASSLFSCRSQPLQSPPPTPSSSTSSQVIGDSPASKLLMIDDSSTFQDSSEESFIIRPAATASAAAAAAAAAGGGPSSRKGTKKNVTTAKQQLTLKQSFARGSKYDSCHPVAQQITGAMATMLVLDLRPISTVSAAGFRHLIEVLCPRYQIPSRQHFTRKAIPNLYQEVRKNLIIALKNAFVPTVHLTTDMWTSGIGQTKDYMSVTAHWVGESLPVAAGSETASTNQRQIIPRQATLCITGFSKRHTADNLLEKLRDVIETWLTPHGLSSGYVISDNAANIVRALQQGEFHHIPCFAHTINLVVQTFLRHDRDVQAMLSVARKISGHFRHSATACRRLQQLQEEFNLPCHQLKQEVVTRWNSTLYMLQRMEEQQKAIHAYSTRVQAVFCCKI